MVAVIAAGVSGAIKRQAGYSPFNELARDGLISLGGAVETTAGRLPFKAIADWDYGTRTSRK